MKEIRKIGATALGHVSSSTARCDVFCVSDRLAPPNSSLFATLPLMQSATARERGTAYQLAGITMEIQCADGVQFLGGYNPRYILQGATTSTTDRRDLWPLLQKGTDVFMEVLLGHIKGGFIVETREA